MVSTVKVASVACAVAEFEETVNFLDSLPSEVSKVEEMNEKKKLLSRGAVAFMALKRTTRESLLGAEELRKDMEVLKKELDREYTKVATLEYRRTRLAGEVELCEKCECPGLARVLAEQASDSITAVEDASAEKQSQRLDALDAELKERARLVDLVEKARSRKSGLESELESSRATLQILPKLLEELAKAAEPLAAILSPPIAKKRKLDEGSAKNGSLFVLWGMLSQCADAFDPLAAVVEVKDGSVVLKLGDSTTLTFQEPVSEEARRSGKDVEIAVRNDGDASPDFLENLYREEEDWIESLVDGRLTHRSVFTRIAKRVQANKVLDKQLSLLHRRPPKYVVHDNFKRALSAPADSLKTWALVSRRQYQATFQHNNSRSTLKVVVDIPPDYPDRAPLFTVSHSSLAPLAAFRDVERELNTQYDSLVDPDSILNLLSHQLAKLNQIFVLLVANPSAPPSHNGVHSRSRRGRDRRRTLLAAPELNFALVHRIM